MVGMRTEPKADRVVDPRWPAPPTEAPKSAPAPAPGASAASNKGPLRRLLGLSFEAKAQDLLPAAEVPQTKAGLGSWWGRLRATPVVKATLLGASSFMVAFGAQVGSIGRSFAAKPKPKAQVVFVGMNEGARYEADKLKQWAPEGVAFVGPRKLQDRALVKGQLVDLSSPDGQQAFAHSLGLEGPAAAKMQQTLALTEDWGRDEMAQLARLFAQAERGERSIERLVLSGHSLGAGLWGDDNGEIGWAALESLAQTFPKAARQVKDVMVAACYAGGRTQVERFKGMFPKAESMWGYSGSAPGAHSGAVWHMKRWEKQTRGNKAPTVNRASVSHLRKGKNVAVWTEAKGYDNGQPQRPIAQLQADYGRTRDLVPLYLSGARQMKNPGQGPLREHYNNLQALLQRTDLPETQRAPLEAERSLVIRLIYYPRVAGYFAAEHKAAIDGAYAALGKAAPDFATLPRKAALAEILSLQKALTTKDDPQLRHAEALLTEGLRDLSAERIPSAWL